MNITKNILKILILQIIVLKSSGLELNENLSCSVNKPFVYFINGVWNFSKPKETKDRLLEIYGDDIEKNFMPKYLSPFNKNKAYELDFLHNQSENKFLDIIEVINQKIDEYEGQNDPSIWLNVASLIFSPELRPTRLSTTALASAIDNIYFTAITKGLTEPPRTQDIAKGFDELSKRLRQKQKVIIVSHSQGNLFANEIVKKIKEDSSLADYHQYLSVLKLASPTNVSYTNERHIKYDRDFVVKLFAPAANYYLKPNVTKVNWSLRDYAFGSTYGHTITEYTKTPENFSGHGVVEVYLNERQRASQTIDGSYENTPVDFFVYEMNQLALDFPDNCSRSIEIDEDKVSIRGSKKENSFKVEIEVPTSAIATDFLEYKDSTQYEMSNLKLRTSHGYFNPEANAVDDKFLFEYEIPYAGIQLGYRVKNEETGFFEYVNEDYGYDPVNLDDTLFTHSFLDKFNYYKVDFDLSKKPICYKSGCCDSSSKWDDLAKGCLRCPSRLSNNGSSCVDFIYKIDVTLRYKEYWYSTNAIVTCMYDWKLYKIYPGGDNTEVHSRMSSVHSVQSASENKSSLVVSTVDANGEIITLEKELDGGVCNAVPNPLSF